MYNSRVAQKCFNWRVVLGLEWSGSIFGYREVVYTTDPTKIAETGTQVPPIAKPSYARGKRLLLLRGQRR